MFHTSNPHQSVSNFQQVFVQGMFWGLTLSGLLAIGITFAYAAFTATKPGPITPLSIGLVVYLCLVTSQYHRIFVAKKGPSFGTFGCEGSSDEMTSRFHSWAVTSTGSVERVKYWFYFIVNIPFMIAVTLIW